MRTTVPPPGTGAGSPTDAYYNGAGAGAPAAAAPAAVAPAATTPVVPPPDKRFSTPGGMNLPLGSVNHHKATEPSDGEVRAGATSLARTTPQSKKSAEAEADLVTLASAEEEVADESEPELNSDRDEIDSAEDDSVTEATRVVASNPIRPASNSTPLVPSFEEEATDDEMAQSGPSEPAPSAAGSVKFADQEASSAAESSVASTGGLRVAAATPPIEPSSTANPADTSEARPRFYHDRRRAESANSRLSGRHVAATGNQGKGIAGDPPNTHAEDFAHHEQYEWLKGKLEYSPASRRWKLRYIPLDGDTDGFGGSVILGNPPELTGFSPGDWVTVRGQVSANPSEAGGFSPPYELVSIERQSK